jgi:hypothetical protein
VQEKTKKLHQVILFPTNEARYEALKEELKSELGKKDWLPFNDESLSLQEVLKQSLDSPFSFYRKLKEALHETEALLNIRATILAKAMLAIGEKTESKNLCLKN